MMSQSILITKIVGYENAKPKKALVKSIIDQGFLVESIKQPTTSGSGKQQGFYR